MTYKLHIGCPLVLVQFEDLVGLVTKGHDANLETSRVDVKPTND